MSANAAPLHYPQVQDDGFGLAPTVLVLDEVTGPAFMAFKAAGARPVQPAFVSRTGTLEGDHALAFAEIDAAFAKAHS